MQLVNSKEYLNTVAPSALSTGGCSLVKPSYGFISTAQIVDRFEQQGWQIERATQARVKRTERQGFQKHLLRFRHPGLEPIMLRGVANIPELVVLNSHDGSSALRIMVGVFRTACLNGIIAGSTMAQFRLIHSQNQIKRLDQGIEEMVANIPYFIQRLNQLANQNLTVEQTLRLAEQAAALRLANVNYSEVDYRGMLTPKRSDDAFTDAYTVFNVLQEKLIRGGIYYKIENTERPSQEEWRRTRAVSSVHQNVRLNRGLFDAVTQLIA